MAESDLPDDEADTNPSGRGLFTEGDFEESEHTVIDSELSELLREVVNDEEALDFDATGTDAALEGLGPAFPSDIEDLDEIPGSSSTRILKEEASWDPLEVDFDSSRVSAAGVVEENEEESSVEQDDWALPAGDESRVDTVIRAWETLEEKDGAWEGVSGTADIPTGPEAGNSDYSRADTGIHDDDMSGSAVEGGRLVCVEGPVKGQEFPLLAGPTYIGRGVSNEIVIEDGSVSRVHAVVHFRDGIFSIEDKDSNNGLEVNGEKISAGTLTSGDEVVFGSVVFKFLEVGDVFKGVEEEEQPMTAPVKERWWDEFRSRSYFRSLAVSMVLLLGTGAGVGGIFWSRMAVEQDEAHSDLVFQHYLSGIEAFKLHHWGRARNEFEVLKRLAPEDERADRYLKAIALESKSEDKLARAKRYRSDGNLKGAYSLAGKVTRSIYFSDEAMELLSTIDGELDAQIARARTSIGVGQYAEGLNLLERVEAVRPGRPEVAALRDMANRALKPVEEAKRTRPSTNSGRAAAKGKSSSPPSRVTFSGELGRAQRLFTSGDIPGALTLLQGARSDFDSRMLAERIRSFDRSYRAGVDAHRAKRPETGIKHLTSALKLERQIAGGKSSFSDSIRKKLADLLYVRAQQAMSSGRWTVACDSFNKAIDYVPGYERAQRGLQELEKKAVELYNEGYVVRESDPGYAKERWRLVLKIVKPGHPYYEKAKSRLKRMP